MYYRAHHDYLRLVAPKRVERANEIRETIREALGEYVVSVATEEVRLGEVTADRLADLLLSNPSLLKPLIAACNMGKRAIRKDLGMEVDTFRPRLDAKKARDIADYLLPSLPPATLIECLIALDAYQWTDSAIRKAKGRWERQFGEKLRALRVDCKKRKFKVGNQEFEIDLAYPRTGAILLAVDIKMIGHPSDKHKRGDEIANKAREYKASVPGGRFVSVVYYPFDSDRDSLKERLLLGASVDDVIFAADDEKSVEDAVNEILGHYRALDGG